MTGDNATSNTMAGNNATSDTMTGDNATSNTRTGDNATSNTMTGDNATSNTMTGDNATHFFVFWGQKLFFGGSFSPLHVLYSVFHPQPFEWSHIQVLNQSWPKVLNFSLKLKIQIDQQSALLLLLQ